MRNKKTCVICLFILIAMSSNSVFAFSWGNYSYDKDRLKMMQKKYEVEMPHFAKSHKALKPLSTITKPRYTKQKGVYRSSTVKKDGVATIMLTGDLMCQTKQQTAAKKYYGKYSFNDNFYYIKKVLNKADLVVGNLETTLSESASYMSEEGSVDNHPNCNAPSTFLDALRYAGFDVIAGANNHNCDTGLKGIFQTCAHLNQYGIAHTGVYDSENADRYIIAEVDGIKIGILSYSTIYNGRHVYFNDSGQNVILNKFEETKVIDDVKAVKQAGAEYIITYIHWGTEYSTKNNSRQTEMAKVMADAGVDFIIGSHPHVLQKYGVVYSKKGKKVHVMYSMGNFVSHMKLHDESKDSIVLRIKLKRNSKGKVYLAGKSYIPCRCVTRYSGHNYTVVPLTKERCKKSNNKKYFNASYKRIKKILGNDIAMLGTYRH